MKIKNECVNIKIGNKTYTKKNMILNTYLYRLFDSQLSIPHYNASINVCYLKFNTSIENVDYNTILNPTDFDIKITNFSNNEDYFKRTSEYSKNLIKLKYVFDKSSMYSIGGGYYASNILNQFNNKRITAIAFGNSDSYFGDETIFAFLDTTNMNIILNSSEEISITRIDLIQSDGICNKEFPLHLVNDMANKNAYYDDTIKIITKAQLYSIGFGNTLGLMEEEYLIDDVEIERDNNSITFNVNRTKKLGHYPSEDLQLGFYPTMDNSKYILFKYRLYKCKAVDNSLYEYLDEYYTMSMPNKNFGNLEIKLKIERL